MISPVLLILQENRFEINEISKKITNKLIKKIIN